VTGPLHILLLTRTPVPAADLDRVRAVSPRVDLRTQVVARLADVDPASWEGAEVLYTTSDLPASEQAPALRWVQAHYAGINRLLEHPLLKRPGLRLTTMSGVHGVNMGEHVLMLMLACAHQLPLMLRAQTAREWSAERVSGAVRELRGATLGILGYGSIGREAARQARALGMRVLASKRDVAHPEDTGWYQAGTGDPTGALVERFYGPDNWRDLLPECDFVLVAAPLTPGTQHLIDAAALKAMRPTAVLMNVARGDLVDEPALIAALQAGTIGGAALDVFAQEPLPPGSPLWDLPNVIITPHMAGSSPAYNTRAMTLFAENVRRYLAGEPLLNVVDVGHGY
jgi:phosphoglycerate dehydrogenase-like enzyme